MRQKLINVCTFGELSKQSQDRAMQNYAGLFGYERGDEAFASLKALADHFDGRLMNYEVDFFNTSYSSADFDMPEMEREEIASRLQALGGFNPETLMGHGDCKLTGYCADEDAIDGFRMAFTQGEEDLTKLMEAAFRSWLKHCQADCDDFYTVKQFEEHADANTWEYTEDGELA